MAYYDNYYEARQHLNLSQVAYDIIDHDRYIFLEKPSFAKMLNRVFATYRDYADASISLACENYEAFLKNQLLDLQESAEKIAVISTLLLAHKQALIQKAHASPRGVSFKFQLDRENYAFISEWKDSEDVYDGIAGRYIKAVVEEYARKPLVLRESIVFRELIETINESIATQHLLIITLNSGKRYEVKPFCVCTDQGYNYHYLAGFSKSSGTNFDVRPVSFRISNIQRCKKTGKSGHLTDAQKKDITEKIRTVGVQFLLQDPETIKIKLSKRGKAMYDSQAHLRPDFIRRSESLDGTWVYEFICTQIQARFYFFKFGAEAEVILPPSLREEFKQLYSNALELYK